ncbi:hypothetical protein ACFL1G_11165 [Planctomycetota bacterium]
MKHFKNSPMLAIIIFALLLCSSTKMAYADEVVIFVLDTKPGPAAVHGVNKVKLALQEKGFEFEQVTTLDHARGQILIVAGLATGTGQAAKLLKDLNIPAPTEPEALLIRHIENSGKKLLLTTGADDRGLMYALLDIAESIGFSSDPENPLSKVENIREKPYVAERALSKYTMHKLHFESYFFDEEYWARYLDVLAKNRFNTFALLFGYENQGYFSPPYPYFFDVEGFPEVNVVGLTKDEQKRNLDMLNRLIEMTHERGINFTLGIWDHFYRVHDADRPGLPDIQEIVSGLTRKTLVPYTKAALAKLLQLVPNIDTIHFRMHYESGLRTEEYEQFWGNIFETVKNVRPDIRFDARAKGLPDPLINKAIKMGINFRITTKYWTEQLGLPFHPTSIFRENQFERRHGYADLLRYPQKYKIHWRLWNCGARHVLLWGDPDYVRRFAGSTHLYDGEGFEINEPLATKMWYHPHDMEPFELLRPQYQYYDWEFERYWHFFQLFGRLGYNPETPPEIWRREFEKRFGKQAAPFVEKAIHHASQILPRIVAYCLPLEQYGEDRSSCCGGWVEKQRREDLPLYADAPPSDAQQFLSMDDAARFNLEGFESAKIWPQETSKWFAAAAAEVMELVEKAEGQIGSNTNKEFFSTMVDLKILANLALYHSRRIHAGLAWASFKRNYDLNAFDDAIYHENSAIQAWQKIVDTASDVYAEDLKMGSKEFQAQGHWKDELVQLRIGLKKLQAKRKNFKPPLVTREPVVAHVPIRKSLPGEELLIKVTASSNVPVTNVRIAYRCREQVDFLGHNYKYINLEQNGQFIYCGTIPGIKGIDRLEYFVDARNQDFRDVFGSIPIDQKNTYPPTGASNPITVIITDDTMPPVLKHKAITSAPALKPLKITAEVQDPSGIKWVRLRYRSVTQFEDYKTLSMSPTQNKYQYQAEVPAEHIVPEWDFMYFFEVMDNCGNGKIYPDLEKETPYIVVELKR